MGSPYWPEGDPPATREECGWRVRVRPLSDSGCDGCSRGRASQVDYRPLGQLPNCGGYCCWLGRQEERGVAAIGGGIAHPTPSWCPSREKECQRREVVSGNGDGKPRKDVCGSREVAEKNGLPPESGSPIEGRVPGMGLNRDVVSCPRHPCDPGSSRYDSVDRTRSAS